MNANEFASPAALDAIARIIVKTEPNGGYGKPTYFANEYGMQSTAYLDGLEVAFVYTNDLSGGAEGARSIAEAYCRDCIR